MLNLQLTYTFTIHVPSFITVQCVLFIMSQFTNNAENVPHRPIVDCRTISKVPGPLWIILQALLNTLAFLIFPTDKNQQLLGSSSKTKCLPIYIGVKFLLWFCVGRSLKISTQVVDTPGIALVTCSCFSRERNDGFSDLWYKALVVCSM
jgi:hypothetical protein